MGIECLNPGIVTVPYCCFRCAYSNWSVGSYRGVKNRSVVLNKILEDPLTAMIIPSFTGYNTIVFLTQTTKIPCPSKMVG